MVITCQQCSARLQLDDTKIPARAFTVRCPKCQHVINAQPAAQEPAAGGALGLGEVPAAHSPRTSRPAPIFKPDAGGADAADGGVLQGDRDEVTNLLSALLQRAMTTAAAEASRGVGRLDLTHRCVLVCASPEHRFNVARTLVESGHEVYVAEDTTQAIERMRERKMDVVILEPTFDAVEQGAAFIRREIAALRPVARRRLFFVVLSADLRSGDTHQAFLAHANLALNPADLDDLPVLLDRGIRDFNELYREFNRVQQFAQA
ncbi:MAG TPA: zinc-ribbon domain-containing protein [Pyrinomonadaceae bacterium]|nr:zinc-ribbon domain-containing protein [Pyrinomonadaceae bacterium]